jgi:DNA-binding response OmpR family regulator
LSFLLLVVLVTVVISWRLSDGRSTVDEPAPAVLVVEDDDCVRDTISEVLIETGFCVHTAATGWEALALLDERPFDIIIADISLPGGLNGLEMAQSARLRHPTLKCLFISGQRDPIICDPQLDDFVPKPFRPFELLGCVWKVLRGNHPQPRLEIARQF